MSSAQLCLARSCALFALLGTGCGEERSALLAGASEPPAAVHEDADGPAAQPVAGNESARELELADGDFALAGQTLDGQTLAGQALDATAPPMAPPEEPLGPNWLQVDVSEQRLYLARGERVLQSWPVSTSAVGIGSQSGSNRTPLGLHRIAETFGAGAPLGTIFRARANTGVVARIHTDATDVPEDHVLTRILWLDGLEHGHNRGGQVDSYLRTIYIHGTNEEGLIGQPASHGCVRMRNADVIALFEEVGVGTEVWIVE